MNEFQHPIVRRYADLLRSTKHLLTREDIALMHKAYSIVLKNENDDIWGCRHCVEANYGM